MRTQGKDVPTKPIKIIAGELTLSAELNNGPTASQIWKALPLEGKAKVWGDEIYFEIPVLAELEPQARADIEVGELAYWPTGRAFCIFFGPTPASTDGKPRAYSPVNIVGHVAGDATRFRSVPDGMTIQIEAK